MASIKASLILIALLPLLSALRTDSAGVKTDSESPVIIGVVSTPSEIPGLNATLYSYIKQTFPQFVEYAGATPIYIPHNLPDDDLYELLGQVHAILFTGGDAEYWTNETETHKPREFTPYMYDLGRIVRYVDQRNKEGEFMPLFGICQGYEVILMTLTKDPYLLQQNFNDSFVYKPIYITPKGYNSRMYSRIDEDLLISQSHNGTFFFNHHFAFNRSSLDRYPLLERDLTITALGYDRQDLEYVASYESKSWPMYLILFHAEKVLWQSLNHKFNHSHATTELVKNVAKFWVEEARLSPRAIPADGIWKKYDFKNFGVCGVDVGDKIDGLYMVYVAKGTEPLVNPYCSPQPVKQQLNVCDDSVEEGCIDH